MRSYLGTMREFPTTTALSAIDVSNHLSCAHLTTLNAQVAAGKLKRPYFDDPSVAALQRRGLEHEAAYEARLTSPANVTSIHLERPTGKPSRESYEAAVAETLAALQNGYDVICQPTLFDGTLQGRADFLVKVDTPSALGDYCVPSAGLRAQPAAV